ncbi:MAG: terminase small subunit [Treponema sp.]|nr:terminase small subunit [Treponema sp.]
MIKKKTVAQKNTYQGITIDITGISNSLTDKAKRFVFWFCFPGADTFQNKTRAAIAAGYASRNAHISGYKLCKNPKVLEEIEKISKKINTETVDILYRRYINSLENRAFYDLADYVSGTSFKPIEEIAPEKRMALEQPIIDMKEGKIVGYSFGSKRAAMGEIKELYQRQNPGGDDDVYDAEETIRIMNELAKTEVYIERRKRRDEMVKQLEDDGFIQRPSPEYRIEEP